MGLSAQQIDAILKNADTAEGLTEAIKTLILQNNSEMESQVSEIATQSIVGKLTPPTQEEESNG